MTSTTFFIIFIPILAILLLAINLILAPHNPYQEKDSTFECGFHSFLGQNRTQFSVSFFIFGLLFLLFDLEILLVYPYSVSSYTNDIYGLVIMMMFFLLLTLGFIFELGKNALTIDSRQTSYNNGDLSTPHAFISSALSNSYTYSFVVKMLMHSVAFLVVFIFICYMSVGVDACEPTVTDPSVEQKRIFQNLYDTLSQAKQSVLADRLSNGISSKHVTLLEVDAVDFVSAKAYGNVPFKVQGLSELFNSNPELFVKRGYTKVDTILDHLSTTILS